MHRQWRISHYAVHYPASQVRFIGDYHLDPATAALGNEYEETVLLLMKSFRFVLRSMMMKTES